MTNRRSASPWGHRQRVLDVAVNGQALVEYGLVIIVVLTGAMAGLLAFRGSVDILWVLVNTLQDTFS